MREKLKEKFGVPDVAANALSIFFTEDEMDFVEKIEKDIFTYEDIERILGKNPEEFIKSAYHRGVISIDDIEKGTYTICNFRRFIDIFVVIETKKYKSIPNYKEISDWYFEEYYKTKDPDPRVKASPDVIMTRDEVCEFIDSQDRPIYLSYCDCRSFAGDCEKPTKTCLTYHSEPNSYVHRGVSEKIDKERAKQVVRDADKAGLMHTVNNGGVCNCCRDCCYLFKAQRRRKSEGFWPESRHSIKLHEDKCIGCGKCTRRCWFQVFTKKGKNVTADPTLCVGCGICATECPAKAIEITDRN